MLLYNQEYDNNTMDGGGMRVCNFCVGSTWTAMYNVSITVFELHFIVRTLTLLLCDFLIFPQGRERNKFIIN